MLLRQILFDLAIAAIADAVLMRISAGQVLSLHTVALRYLKLVTSKAWSFMLLSALMAFVFFVMILLLSAFTCALALSMS